MAGRRRNKRKKRSKGSCPDAGAEKDSILDSPSGQTPKDKRTKRRLGKELRTRVSMDNTENMKCATATVTTRTEVHDAVNGISSDKGTCHATITSKTTSKGKEDYQSVKTKNRHEDNHSTIHDVKSNLEVAEGSSFDRTPRQTSRSNNQTATLLKEEKCSKNDDCKDNRTRGEKVNEISVACENNSSVPFLKYPHEKKRRKKSNRKTEDSSKDKVGDSHNYESNNTPVILSTLDQNLPGNDCIDNVKVSSTTPEIDLGLEVPEPVVKVKCEHMKKKKNNMLVTNCESSNTPVVLSTSNEIFPGKDNINDVKAGSMTPEIDLDLDVPEPAVKAKSRHRKKKKNQSDIADKDLCLCSSDVGSSMKIHDKGVHNCLEISAEEVNNTSEDSFSNSIKSEMPIEVSLLPAVVSSNIVKEQSTSLLSLTRDIQQTLSHSSQKKLLVLDLNGLLVDINPDYRVKSDKRIGGKAVFKRPFCDEFLKFCFERFNIGVWSSRRRQNVDAVVDYAMGDFRHKLLFSWDQSKCTDTGQRTLENRHKPLVLKELSKLWNKEDDDLPWEKGEYQPSNTLLVDDSPYKAICNPPHTAIFPFPYHFHKENDNSLGSQGDLRCYLEGLAMAVDVQLYVRDHPFGQKAISDTDPSWKFYLGIIDKIKEREKIHSSS